MFNHLRKSLIFFIINRHFHKTHLAGPKMSLHTAHNIGIMAVIDSKERLDRIVNLKKNIESYGPKVFCIAYIPLKAIPDYFNTQMQVNVFSKKDVNVFGIPRGKHVKDFLGRDYDILVDLTYNDCLPLIYIAGMTRAGVKAGKYREGMLNVYDFMIMEKETRDYGDFIFSMKNYLSKINN